VQLGHRIGVGGLQGGKKTFNGCGFHTFVHGLVNLILYVNETI
jgi:hypothetical protein